MRPTRVLWLPVVVLMTPVGVVTMNQLDQLRGFNSVPVTMKVKLPFLGNRPSVSFRLPVPLAVPQTAPPVPTHVHVQLVPLTAGGKLSVTTTPDTASGPVLLIVMVKVMAFEMVMNPVGV